MERFAICETNFGGILDIPVSNVNVESYICCDHCFRSLKRFEKLQEHAKTIHRTLKENFVRHNVKRGVPSDSAISPSVASVAAPTKYLHQGEDQRRVKFVKSLSYGEILLKPNPEYVIFWSTETPRVNCIQFGTIFFLQVFWHAVCNFVRLQ